MVIRADPPSASRFLLGALVMICGVILPFALSMMRRKKSTSQYRRLRSPSQV